MVVPFSLEGILLILVFVFVSVSVFAVVVNYLGFDVLGILPIVCVV